MALAAVACSSSPTPTAHQTPQVLDLNQGPSQDQPAADTTPQKTTGGRGLPVSVDIPAINVHARNLVALGLNKDGSVAVPSVKTPEVMGFYGKGGRPCDPNPSPVSFAVLAHIDGSGHKGALYDLKDLKPGAIVTVGLDTGQTCSYRISELAHLSKANFPTSKVWGPAKGGIRIISCGDKWVGGQYGYENNLVGIGSLVS